MSTIPDIKRTLPGLFTGVLFLYFLLCSNCLLAKSFTNDQAILDVSSLPDPFYLLFFLIGIALLPFIAIMTTSFTKIVVVLSIARQAIGTAQSPPNVVIMGVAIMLTCFSMYPTALEIYANVEKQKVAEKQGVKSLLAFLDAAEGPIKKFMVKHAKDEDRQLFQSLSEGSENEPRPDIASDSLIILAPAFLISELSHAFQIGFLIYLPFLVIDMTVANLLMALGMQMLAPTTISLPFKILLFVLVDGWRLLSEGLVKV